MPVLRLPLRRRGGGGWPALALLLASTAARANVGPPSSGGQLVAEPVGVLRDVAITREALTIDLRPLAGNGLARVEAVYHLYNRGDRKTIDLIFASGADDVADFEVRLDDRRLASAPDPRTQLPESWRPPRYTPGLHGEGELEYLRWHHRRISPVGFTAEIPPGRHTLAVRYAAEASTHLHGHPTVYRQFAYVLAPARAWAAFGGLDVTVVLPPGWAAASTPPLARDGDTLRGSFKGVPADALALTVQAPEGWAYPVVLLGSLGVLGLVLLVGPFVCWWGGRSRGRFIALGGGAGTSWLRRHAWPKSLGLGLAWALAILGVGLLATFGPDWVLPAGQVTYYGYGQFFAVLGLLFLGAVAVPVGFAIAQLTAVVVRSRLAAQPVRVPRPPADHARPAAGVGE
jgi:hypothetical protein